MPVIASFLASHLSSRDATRRMSAMELLASLLEVLSISSMAKAATQLLRSRSNSSSRRRQWSHADERSGLGGLFVTNRYPNPRRLRPLATAIFSYCFGKDVWVSPTLPDFFSFFK